MNPSTPDSLSRQSLIETLLEGSRRLASAQHSYLALSRAEMREMAAALQPGISPDDSAKPVLFSRYDLEEFALRSIARCFGPEYKIFEGRRYPRIPNGDLLLMDRVTELSGTRHTLKPDASITTEFDISRDAWFYNESYRTLPPYGILMEMALQPCGFLSAYLGSSFLLPTEDLYFRNLDGTARVHAYLDLRGKTITAQAVLLSSNVSGTTIIQKFSFSLSCGGEKFYSGESVFGYFSREGMAKQVGLDSGKTSSTGAMRPARHPERYGISFQLDRRQQLDLLDEMTYEPAGGKFARGLLQASQHIRPSDWFYACHFHQDPVMPGSLGIEAALQALGLAARARQSPGQQVHFGHPINTPFTWKYRGQVLPSHQEMTITIDVTSSSQNLGSQAVIADASLWVDGTRIYGLSGLSLVITS